MSEENNSHEIEFIKVEVKETKIATIDVYFSARSDDDGHYASPRIQMLVDPHFQAVADHHPELGDAVWDSVSKTIKLYNSELARTKSEFFEGEENVSE